MKRKIYSFIFCKVLGWKVIGHLDRDIKKCVIIAVPHTSWWDFFLGIFSRAILGIEINYVAKKELFVFPFGLFFKWTGGTPLNRQKSENKVDAIYIGSFAIVYKLKYDDGLIAYNFINRKGEYIELHWTGVRFII